MPRPTPAILVAAIAVAALTACSSGNAAPTVEPPTGASAAPETQAQPETAEPVAEGLAVPEGEVLEFDGWEVIIVSAAPPAPGSTPLMFGEELESDDTLVELRYHLTRTADTVGPINDIGAEFTNTAWADAGEGDGSVWPGVIWEDNQQFEIEPGESIVASFTNFVDAGAAASGTVEVRMQQFDFSGQDNSIQHTVTVPFVAE